MVGEGRFELPTSRLSGVRSNQLSYSPQLSDGERYDERSASVPGNWIVRVTNGVLTYEIVPMAHP